MNLEYFVARRIAQSKGKSFSRFIVRLAIIAIALSLAVMIITTAIVTGFKKEISEKMFGFWGHIHINHLEANRSYQEVPVNKQQNFYPSIDTLKEIRHIQVFAKKAGIIKTDTEMEGIVLKGIGSDFDWRFFERYLVAGSAFSLSDTSISKYILISQATASRLNFKVGDDVVVYFSQKPTRVRKFEVGGVYKTGLEEFDRMFALVDIGHIQKLNNWARNQVGGFEIFIHDVNQLDEIGDFIYYSVLDPSLYAQTIKEMQPAIFDWLGLQDINTQFILRLMVLVAAINMITALLILILERTNMIGILKALGAKSWSIRKIFLYNAAYIIGIGLFWGNVLGIGLCLIQQYFHLIKLPEASYYISVAPINLDMFFILGLNVGTLIICLLLLLLPSYLVTRINPIKAIRWA